MGHQNKEVDPESLRERRHGGCLNIFLVVSIAFLFVAVTALAAAGMMSVMQLRSKLESSLPNSPYEMAKSTGAASPVYKMQNVVYLRPDTAILGNMTMEWSPTFYGDGETIGSNYIYDKAQHTLKPQREGMYFIYIQLNLTCTHKCSAGVLSINVGNKLTCHVDLPEKNRPVSKKCWTVARLGVDKLLTHMTVSKALPNWKLESTGSELGMFLVD